MIGGGGIHYSVSIWMEIARGDWFSLTTLVHATRLAVFRTGDDGLGF